MIPPIPDGSAAAQRHGEDRRSYTLFLAFLDQPAPRLTATAARAGGSRESTCRRLAQKFEWHARAEAFDQEQRQQAARDVRDAATDIATGTAEAARAHVRNLQRRAYNLEPDDIPAKDVAAGIKHLAGVAADLGRYATELDDAAQVVVPELRELAEADPDGAVKRTMADFVVDPKLRPAERIAAARELRGAAADDTAASSVEAVSRLYRLMARLSPDAKAELLAAAEAEDVEIGADAYR